jgi:hypothetical protein
VTTDAKLINCFAEKDEEGNFRVYKRPGVAVAQTIPSMPASTAFPLGQFLGVSYATGFFGNNYVLTFFWVLGNLYVSTNGAAPQSIVASQPTFINVVQVSATKVSIAYLGQQIGYDFTTKTFDASGTLLQTPTTYGYVSLDNTFYYQDAGGNIYGSNLGDYTTWTSTNRIGPQAANELGLGCCLHMNYIVSFRTFSFQFYYDAGNPVGSPLLPVPNSNIAWGCKDGGTIQVIEDNVYWLAQSRESGAFVASLVKGREKRISTPGVERLLDDVSGNFYSFSFKDLGHLYYGITVQGTSNLTIVFDITEQIWYVWTDPSGNFWPWFGFVTRTDSTVLCQSLVGTNASYIYQVDEEFYTDVVGTVPTVFPADIYTPNYDGGSRKKDVINRMDFLADQQPGILKVRYNDQDFKSNAWSQFREVNLNQKRPTLTKCGSFRRRSWHFRWVEPYPLRIEAVELDILPGTA